MLLFLSYQVSSIVSRGIGALDVFLTWIFVTSVDPSRLVGDLMKSTSASPLIGGLNFLPGQNGLELGRLGWVLREQSDAAETDRRWRRRASRRTHDARDS